MPSKEVVSPRRRGDLEERRTATLEQLAEIIDTRTRSSRKTAAVSGLIGLVAGAGLTVVGVAIAASRENDGQLVSVDLTTVAVEQRDVVLYSTFAGDLGYGDAATVSANGSGVVTSVAAEGSDLSRGEVLYEIDSEPVALLYGDLPEWRTLSTSSDDGPDILQLETNLAALGYTADGHMTVDDDFTYYTGVALKAWETDLGFSTPDKVFEPSEAVFLPGPIRVDSAVTRGTVASQGTQILEAAIVADVTDTVSGDHTVTSASAPTLVVTLAVSTSGQSVFSEGATVEVVLADGTAVDGLVTSVGDTPRRVSQGPDSDLVVDVVVTVTGDPEILIEGPANVKVPMETIEDALMVPVRALVALLEGGYGVQVEDDAGTHYVGVETGEFVDGWVEVTGDLKAGDLVVVPE